MTSPSTPQSPPSSAPQKPPTKPTFTAAPPSSDRTPAPLHRRLGGGGELSRRPMAHLRAGGGVLAIAPLSPSADGSDCTKSNSPSHQYTPVLKVVALANTHAVVLSRLNQFLPVLRTANEELASAPEAHNIEAVGDDQQYIEMNLGLGVLEEVKRDSSDSESDSDSEGESDGDRDNILAAILKASRRDAKKESSTEGEGQKVAEEGVLAEIMGEKKEGRKVGIEVMDEDVETK